MESVRDLSYIPVIVGTTALMKDKLQTYLDTISGKANKYQVQVHVVVIRETVLLLKRT